MVSLAARCTHCMQQDRGIIFSACPKVKPGPGLFVVKRGSHGLASDSDDIGISPSKIFCFEFWCLIFIACLNGDDGFVLTSSKMTNTGHTRNKRLILFTLFCSENSPDPNGLPARAPIARSLRPTPLPSFVPPGSFRPGPAGAAQSREWHHRRCAELGPPLLVPVARKGAALSRARFQSGPLFRRCTLQQMTKPVLVVSTPISVARSS
jgi:hypothetical protein